MQDSSLVTVTGCNKTQSYNICMTKHSYFPYTRTYSSPRHNTKYTTSITSLTQTYNIIQHSKAKNTLSSTTPATQQTFSQFPHSHYNSHKTNMHHIHTYIVSMHLATRGLKMRKPPPHISSSEEIVPRFTRRTLAQLRIKNLSLKSYIHKVDAKSHPSPLFPYVTLTYTTHIISLTTPTYAHHHP